MKNLLFGILLSIALISCEGKSDMADDNGTDKYELDKTRAKIDSIPSEIKKDYLKSDSLFNATAKAEIELLRQEIAVLREEIKSIKKR